MPRCPGQLTHFRRLVAEASLVLPHHRLQLCFIEGSLEKPMLFCSRCFTYSSGSRRLLVAGCQGPSGKARQSQKAILQRKHPKSGKPLVRIQPLQKELARAISQDVSLVDLPCAEVVLPGQSEGEVVACAESAALVACAAVGSPCLPLVLDVELDDTLEPDPDPGGFGFGWDDPDDF